MELVNKFLKYTKILFFFEFILDVLGIVATYGTPGRIEMKSSSLSTRDKESEVSLLRRFLFEMAKRPRSIVMKTSGCTGYMHFEKRLIS